MPEYVELPCPVEVIGIGDLVVPNAIRLAASAKELPFVEVLDCMRSKVEGEPSPEIVVFEVEVERPQHMHHPIERWERIASVFTPDGDVIPEVLTLRADFPQVPHLNLRSYERPKSLCLYDMDPREVMLRWTPLLFIERIRQWLNLTAKGELHQEDQPLEPLLLESAGTIVLPDAAYEHLTSAENLPVLVYRVSRESERDWVLVAQLAEGGAQQDKPPFVAMGFTCGTTIHGVIQRQPRTIAELASLVKESGLDLVTEIRSRLTEWCQQKDQVELCSKSIPILLVAFPKTREKGRAVEQLEVWAFALGEDLTRIGIDLGVWDISCGKIGLNIPLDETRIGENVSVDPLRPVRAFSQEAAAKLSGLPAADHRKMVLIGVGAMGSHFFLNAVRAGLGQWTVVDNDRLLPHNLARHVLDGRAVGCFKAEYLSSVADHMIDGESVSAAVIADILCPGEKEKEIAAAMDDANVIIDASASICVARYLALDVESEARRISTFFTPSGSASVLLAEDVERRSPLDILEMQYYREIANVDILRDHLNTEKQSIRYGQSCRDLTSCIPEDIVTLHSALSSGAFKKILGQSAAFGGIWTPDPHSQQVGFTGIDPSPVVDLGYGDWRVRTDEKFLKKLADFRVGKLPNETGGVILGTHDMKRHIVYLVETIPSPPDSEEWPTVYIRGRKGLAAEVRRIETTTARNLTYVGEWHSHPDGVAVLPSRDDMKAFSWLRENMMSAGLPPLMVIAGEGGQTAVFVEVM